MNFLRCSFLVFTLLTLGACASTPAPSEPATAKAKASEDALAEELAANILADKLKKNGAYLLCDQPGYTACFNQSTQRCVQMIEPHNVDCYNTVAGKLGAVNTVNTREFGKYFAACLMLKHISVSGQPMDSTAQCIKKANFDDKQGTRSLLK